MIESCAIAYLKEFFIAFMLFLIPILTYDANSVISTFKMKSPMSQMWQENSPFKKSEEIWIMERSAFRLPTEIHIIKRFKESGGLTGRDQTEEDQHMAINPVNIKHVDDYFTVDFRSICTASHNINFSYSL